MRRWLFPFLLAALICIGTPPVQAKISNQSPREAVAFGYRGGTRIAVQEADGNWRLDDLPRAFFGQGDVELIRTVWGLDGRTAYVDLPAPGDGQYRYIYAYDIFTRLLTPVVFLSKAAGSYDYSDIDVSPDGRYLWIFRLGDDSSRLIDTQSIPAKRVLAKIDDCPAEVLAWWAGQVLVQGFAGCAYTNYLFDLSTGQMAFSHLQTEDEDNLTLGPVIVPAGPQPFVLVYSYPTLSKLSLTTGRPEAWLSDTDGFRVSRNGKWATFVRGGHLFSLDLTTLATIDVGTIGPVDDSFSMDDSLSYWTVEPAASPQTIRRVTVKAGQRSDTTVYDAEPFNKVSFAPGGQGFVLDFGAAGGYVVYNATGTPTWHSRNQSFPTDTHLSFDLPPDVWTGDWVQGKLVNAHADESAESRSFAVNMTTGQTILAPTQAPTWVSAAPDGAWWLYSLVSCNDFSKSIILAYNVATGATVPLAQGGLQHSCGVGFPEEAFYSWAPVR